MLMTMIAYAFLQHSPPSNSKAGKKESTGHPPQPILPGVRHAILELIARPPPQRCPHCRIESQIRRKCLSPKVEHQHPRSGFNVRIVFADQNISDQRNVRPAMANWA
jgi:hypothetical protein